jgi:hypothetical protein
VGTFQAEQRGVAGGRPSAASELEYLAQKRVLLDEHRRQSDFAPSGA